MDICEKKTDLKKFLFAKNNSENNVRECVIFKNYKELF
jgi:hypothetical protein